VKNMGQVLGVTTLTLDLPLWVDNINCFLFRGEDGWDILDTGIYTPQTMAKWEEAFHNLRINPLDVRKIVITHDHVDHFGSAGELQKLTQAPVKMVFNNKSLVFLHEWLRVVLEDNIFDYFGLPKELRVKVITEKIEQFKSWVPSIPEVEDLSDQKNILLGNEYYEILKFSGHSSNHICFYHPEKEVLFAGDVLVTPNHLNDSNPDPLTEYFDSLEQLQRIKIACLIPSHGKPFNRVGIRIGLISEYRQQQLVALKEYLDKESSVYEVYLFLLSSSGALADLFFGLTEVFYFLEYLVRKGDIGRVTKKGSFYYFNLEGGEK